LSLVVLAGQGAHLKTFHIPLLLIFPKTASTSSHADIFLSKQFIFGASQADWTRPIFNPPFAAPKSTLVDRVFPDWNSILFKIC
jgi:hypothetical protein